MLMVSINNYQLYTLELTHTHTHTHKYIYVLYSRYWSIFESEYLCAGKKNVNNWVHSKALDIYDGWLNYKPPDVTTSHVGVKGKVTDIRNINR